MTTVLLFAILGLGQGAAYAIMAQGIVLIQRGSGTVNFAQGAIGMMGAFLFADLVRGGMGKPLALVVVLVAAALLGVLWQNAAMRPLRNAPILARIICTLALMTVLQAFAQHRYGVAAQNAVSILPEGSITMFGLRFGTDRLYLVAVTVVIATVLWAWYKFTTFGISTRATAESERGAALLGFSPDLIASANWAIGAVLGALAGILVAPIVGLGIANLTLLIMPALAAALLGNFQSFSVTTVAGIGIGVVQALVLQYWSQPGVVDAVPLVVVIAAMVLAGRTIPARGTLGVARPPLAPQVGVRWPTAVVLIGVAVLGLARLDYLYSSALVTSILTIGSALSVVVVVGFVGQTSLMPMTFAGIGGLLTSKIATDAGLPFPLPILVAVLLTVPVAVVLGLPALRVRGLSLAVVTMGAATAITGVVFNNSEWTGGIQGSLVPSPELFGFSLDPLLYPMRFGIMSIIVIGLLVCAVQNLRRSPSGLRMLAVRSNERAATMSGVSLAATKLHGFALSGAIAAIAGALLSYQLGAVSYERFSVFSSIALIILVYIMGIAVANGAILAGLLTQGGIVYLFLLERFPAIGSYYELIGGILLILTVIGQPDGAVVAARQQAAFVRSRLPGRRPTTPRATRAAAPH